MIKNIFFGILFVLFAQKATAGHIAGGEIYYTWVSYDPAKNMDTYSITLRLFRDCAASGANLAPMPINTMIAIFDKASNNSAPSSQKVARTSLDTITLSSPSPCIINPRPVCYQVGEFRFTKELSRNSSGYTVAYQTCCRSTDIINVQKQPLPGGPPISGEGATYVADIPGSSILDISEHNSSPVFSLKDTVLVCAEKEIKIDFSASDADGDSLNYAFCSAYNRGASVNSSEDYVPTNPPYQNVSYVDPFTGERPLGSNVRIDPNTGIIFGTAPASGVYVVNVCILEWRKGKLISSHRKDFSVKIANCDFATSELPVQQISCNGFIMNFENKSSSSQINSYYWDFGVKDSTSDTSILAKPTYTYADTGVYIAKLIVNKGQACTDSATTEVRVFPGFFPEFAFDNTCISNPFLFQDKSTTKYGYINSHRWDFGNLDITSDTSNLQDPTYKYSKEGNYTVSLFVSSSRGCESTITKTATVFEIPSLSVAFSDTLICSIDSLPLKAIGTGTFNWLPNTYIKDANTATPIVFPKDTTIYTVTLTHSNCEVSKTVTVNTLDFITVNAGEDTIICLTDSITLHTISNGLQYTWSPAETLNNDKVKSPLATPKNRSTTYMVTSRLGKCQASDDITVNAIPYPMAFAGNDTTICFKDTAILMANIVGNSLSWQPARLIRNPTNGTTAAYPVQNTNFILTVYDTLGCPKPDTDTVLVKVHPAIRVFAGNDTTVVIMQPLQLNAVSNATIFNWQPTERLNKSNIANPVAIFTSSDYPNGNFKYTVLASTPEGCTALDSINIKVFVTLPSIFVPNVFTPNNDGKNDKFRPILTGIYKLVYFRIFNRYGQLIFETSEPGKGWDGRINGMQQLTNSYVYSCEAIDYLGKHIIQKGSFMLLR